MTNQIQFSTFNFKDLPVRIITDPNQEYWFCANDVCSILDYANPRQAVQKNCNPKGVSIRDTLTSGGSQSMIFINEPNLYRLIIKSRKPEAERFEAWVFESVLPQIRKTGKYQQPQQLSLPETTHPQPIHWRWQDIRTIAWLWFSHGQMQQHLAKLLPVLETLESSYAARTYSQIHEYCSFYQEATPLIAELLEDCPFDPVNRHHLNRILQELKSLKSETKLKALQQLKGF